MSEVEQMRLELDGEMLSSISLVHRRSYPEIPDQDSPAVMALLEVLDSPEGLAESGSAVFLTPAEPAASTR